MSTASSHSPTELKEGKEGSVQLLSASVQFLSASVQLRSAREMDELRVLADIQKEVNSKHLLSYAQLKKKSFPAKLNSCNLYECVGGKRVKTAVVMVGGGVRDRRTILYSKLHSVGAQEILQIV